MENENGKQTERLLKAKEVLDALRISSAKLSGMVKDGLLKPVCIGKMRRYRQSELDQILNPQQTPKA